MKLAALILTIGALGAVPPPTAHYRHLYGHLLNDLSITPGDALPDADTALICHRGYTATPGVRLVPAKIKDSVYHFYHARKKSDAQHPPSCCEVDHLISLELGGSNAVANLWPEPYPDATAKDKVENALHALVCTGKLSLHGAQEGITHNWVKFRDSLVAAGNWPGKAAENVR